jgi:mRNA deadenylase 3'-5' endonuclease subunit Ccr4
MQSEKHYSSMQVGTMSEDSPSIERVPQQEDDPNKTHSSKTIKRGNTDMSQEHDLTSIGSSFEEYGPYQTQYPCGVDDDICLHDQLHDSSDRRR